MTKVNSVITCLAHELFVHIGISSWLMENIYLILIITVTFNFSFIRKIVIKCAKFHHELQTCSLRRAKV